MGRERVQDLCSNPTLSTGKELQNFAQLTILKEMATSKELLKTSSTTLEEVHLLPLYTFVTPIAIRPEKNFSLPLKACILANLSTAVRKPNLQLEMSCRLVKCPKVQLYLTWKKRPEIEERLLVHLETTLS